MVISGLCLWISCLTLCFCLLIQNGSTFHEVVNFYTAIFRISICYILIGNIINFVHFSYKLLFILFYKLIYAKAIWKFLKFKILSFKFMLLRRLQDNFINLCSIVSAFFAHPFFISCSKWNITINHFKYSLPMFVAYTC